MDNDLSERVVNTLLSVAKTISSLVRNGQIATRLTSTRRTLTRLRGQFAKIGHFFLKPCSVLR